MMCLTIMLRRLKDAWYYVTCLLWHRYNVVTVRTLPPTWVDRDKLLLHAAFEILRGFVENEQPLDHINWDATPEHAHARDEFMALYQWWKTDRPSRIEPLDNFPSEKIPPLSNLNAPGYDEWRAVCDKQFECEKMWFEEDQTNFKRLIEIRPHLWT